VADSADFIREFALIVLGAFFTVMLADFYRDILRVGIGRILKMSKSINTFKKSLE
jgi:hypothetical protein